MLKDKAKKPLKHGGDLTQASAEFGLPASEWLDLSTGISPWSYPVDNIPQFVWSSLPYDHSGLLAAAADYYQCPPEMITPIAGTQDAIRRIPQLLASTSVAIPLIGYQEHLSSWENAGHRVHCYQTPNELERLVESQQVAHAVVINPNNPTGEWFEKEWLLRLHRQLGNEGLLLVDEAFMDIDVTQSLSIEVCRHNIVVLRSVGKYFGLAGMRLGFLLGVGELVDHLRGDISPWGASYPALWVGEQALKDRVWQQQQGERLLRQSQQLNEHLQRFCSSSSLASTSVKCKSVKCRSVTVGLFVTLFGPVDYLHSIFKQAAANGILLRYDAFSEQQAWLRFGLPGEEFSRLQSFLSNFQQPK